MDHICDWAKEKGLIVLEDACHAHGATLKGKYMGTWGRMGAFSFQGSKPLPAIEGGMGIYQEKNDYERATAYGNYDRCAGEYAQYAGSGLGVKLRMHPMAAQLARLQLKVLEPRNAAGAKQVALAQRPHSATARPLGANLQPAGHGATLLLVEHAVYRREEGRHVARGGVKALQAEGVNTSNHGYTLAAQAAPVQPGPVVAPSAR